MEKNSAINRSITLRPIRVEDESFLFRVFASTRDDVIAWNAGEAQKAEFLRSQFQAQHADYQRRYVEAAFLIVLRNAKRIGRLYLHRGEQEFRIIDLALLPEFRGKGIGSKLLLDILKEANMRGKPVRMYVLHGERGARFLQRHGFEPASHTPTHTLMEFTPGRPLLLST